MNYAASQMGRITSLTGFLSQWSPLSRADGPSNLAKTSVIQGLWKREQRPTLHAWVYGLQTGFIKPLLELGPDTQIDPIYRYDDLVRSDES